MAARDKLIHTLSFFPVKRKLQNLFKAYFARFTADEMRLFVFQNMTNENQI